MSQLKKMTILSVALLLSLSVNIGLASFMAGHRAATVSQAPRATPGGAFAAVLRELPPEQRQTVRKIVSQRRPELRQAIQALQEQRRAVAMLVQSDRVDEADLNQALADLRARTTAAQEAGHQLLKELVPHLTVDQRRELMQRQRNLVR
jgi:uncharacterized membrane protein